MKTIQPISVVVGFRKRWWLDYYLNAICLFCSVFGTEPDYDAIVVFIVRWGISKTIGVKK